ncbi:uncharacterized protein LOC115888610 [Sitophilus oryzae]|uniref:Uncharacterized protein LOC115888610 n=1 Tax=Sitophilus oryzae TaxID=7048 RepID=A0A6J2YLR7_SITOR|nr:uncharacterized protein LOC115888610 [Sitophilus oryzae]
MKRVFSSTQANRLYTRMEKNFLRERIHTSRRDLAKVDRELIDLFYILTANMQPVDWDKIDGITYQNMQNELERTSARQKIKYEKLQPKTKPEYRISLEPARTVVNLTDKTLTTSEVTLLAKGGNFAITPKVVPVEDIIAGTEAAIRNLPNSIADEIRFETVNILRTAKAPKSNLSREEHQALKSLNADKDILVLPADKGNATVVMKSEDYRSKIEDLLEPQTYKLLKKDPTALIVRNTNRLIKASSLPEHLKSKLINSEAQPPRLYGLPKIHKASVPLRPIVSAPGSPTYNLAKYLTTILQPKVGNTNSYVKDSTHFVQKLKDIKLEPSDIMVSFDVVSLFTRVPLGESMDLIKESFPPDIAELFRVCLTGSYFLWNGNYYEQTEGVAMGSPISPIIANFFMERFEEKALESSVLKPAVWFRYVDDTFVVWKHGRDSLDDFLHHLNSQSPSIKFTMETEVNNQLAFLDVLVKRNGDLLDHTVYRKPTHTDRYLHKLSNHHPSQKQGIIGTLANRARRICANEHIQEELSHLNKAFLANGYNDREIKAALAPRQRRPDANEQENIINKAFLPYVSQVTDRIDQQKTKENHYPLQGSTVYLVPAVAYILELPNASGTRLTEHKRNCRLGQTEKSAVAEHALRDGDHKIQFEDTQVIATTSGYHPRLVREAVEIHKHPNNFNRKEETFYLNRIWHPAISRTKVAAQRSRPVPEELPPEQATPLRRRINTSATPTNLEEFTPWMSLDNKEGNYARHDRQKHASGEETIT